LAYDSTISFQAFLCNNNNNNNSVTIPGDKSEKILKYKDLITDIQRVWNVKAKVIAVIVRATGTISESLRQYLSNIPGKHTVKELQRTATFWVQYPYSGKC
jgi:hypothetical protein